MISINTQTHIIKCDTHTHTHTHNQIYTFTLFETHIHTYIPHSYTSFINFVPFLLYFMTAWQSLSIAELFKLLSINFRYFLPTVCNLSHYIILLAVFFPYSCFVLSVCLLFNKTFIFITLNNTAQQWMVSDPMLSWN